MTLLIVIVLVAAWSWWGYVTWRDRRATSGRGANSIASFSNQLSVLERSRPGVRVISGGATAAPSDPIHTAAPVGDPDAVAPPRSAVTAAGTSAVVVPLRGASQAQRLRALSHPQPFESDRPGVLNRPSATLTLSEAQQRRRKAVTALGATTVITALLALFAGGIFVPVALLAVAATVGYVGLLVRARKAQIERVLKVRSLDRQTAPAQGAAVPAGDVFAASGQASTAPALAYGDDHYGSDRYLADEARYAGVAN